MRAWRTFRRCAFPVLVAIWVAAAGCSDDSGDPCSGVGCSSRGFCLVDQGTAYCACMPGFHPSGLACLANDSGNPCAGIECSGHGECVLLEEDDPSCVCEPGYGHLAVDPGVCVNMECDLFCVAGGEAPDAGADADADGEEAPDEGVGCPPGWTDCDGSCVEPASDPSHCGACGSACDPPQAVGECVHGVCEIAACADGWHNLDGLVEDGCEYACVRGGWEGWWRGETCLDGLDNDCDAATDAADPDCVPSGAERCNVSDDDDDGLTDEDFDFDFDPLNCGACGRVCPAVEHGVSACVLGHCDVVCEPGWSDLDGNVLNGCEATCRPGGALDEAACDGVDDDCDGETDEGWTAATTCGVGACAREAVCWRGEVVCRGREAAAVDDSSCNGVDDDCDGETDEEWFGRGCVGACATTASCVAGVPACGLPAPEDATCNGIDEDCDGSVDEDWVPGRCGAGACERLATCVDGVVDCVPGDPAVERCDGPDSDCDGLSGCDDPDCFGWPCDDGDACTHTDVCGDGICAGTPITCASDVCATRACNGTSSCTVTPHPGVACASDDNPCTSDVCGTAGECTHVPVAAGTACPDDGRVCTNDWCDAAGTCTHPNKPAGTACTSDGNACTNDACDASGSCAHTAVADGTSCGTTWQKCCGGVCRNLSTDRSNCAGCWLACATGYNCLIPSGYSHPTCDCGGANAQCHGGVGQVCSTTYGVCACTSSSGCAPGQRCVDITGPNYCTY